MLKGIYGKYFIDVEHYIDIAAFKTIHANICQGFVLAQRDAHLGLLSLYEPNKEFVNLDTYKNNLKPVWYMYDKFIALPDDHPIKIAGSQFNNNDLILYITYAFGAHNPYKVYEVFNHTEKFESTHFLPVVSWLNNLKIFSHIENAYFLIVEGGGISIEHSDPEHDDIKKTREFIYVRSDLNRPFYIKDISTDKKVYINTQAVYFNDQDYHGSDSCPQSTYVLRIDGIFTEEFKSQLCIKE